MEMLALVSRGAVFTGLWESMHLSACDADECRPRVTLWGLMVYLFDGKKGQIIQVWDRFPWNKCLVE